MSSLLEKRCETVRVWFDQIWLGLVTAETQAPSDFDSSVFKIWPVFFLALLSFPALLSAPTLHFHSVLLWSVNQTFTQISKGKVQEQGTACGFYFCNILLFKPPRNDVFRQQNHFSLSRKMVRISKESNSEMCFLYMFTLFLPLSQEPRLARIWLSIAVTHESLSSMLGASKCHVCPVNDTMMKSAFSSSAKRGWSRRNMTWDLLHSTNRENESIELSVGGGKMNEKHNKTKQWFRLRHEDRKIFGLFTLRVIQTNNGV